jgi:hypothetical protein
MVEHFHHWLFRDHVAILVQAPIIDLTCWIAAHSSPIAQYPSVLFLQFLPGRGLLANCAKHIKRSEDRFMFRDKQIRGTCFS